ncbi:MAG: DUF177 domain-containing protein [Thalassobaculaceae bacterium]|nr:DUF177 domain-containing protein [Thalassobaculaceae bacterium]
MTDPVTSMLVAPIPVARIGQQRKAITFEADATARSALAQRFGLIELPSFSAEATLRRRRDTGWIELKGTLQARVVQECVVTLEPVIGEVEAVIDELFDDSRDTDGTEVDLDPIAEDPEPLESDELDVGEIIAQVLSLAIDPYPRAPGAPAPESSDEGSAVDVDGQEGAKASPFAALALLKDRNVKKR